MTPLSVVVLALLVFNKFLPVVVFCFVFPLGNGGLTNSISAVLSKVISCPSPVVVGRVAFNLSFSVCNASISFCASVISLSKA